MPLKKKTNSRIKVLLVGAKGRMGKSLASLFRKSSQYELVFSIYSSSDWLNLPRTLDVDIVVDFSSPRGFQAALDFCSQRNLPFFTGTTGISHQQKMQLKKRSRGIPICWAPNCSLGMLVVQQFLKSLSSLTDWSASIHEIHHKNKKDKPSGTALMLKETLQGQFPKVNVTSLRKGEVIGIHEVRLRSTGEQIVIRHEALSRKLFASGAMQGIQKLHNASPGLYSMSDLIFT